MLVIGAAAVLVVLLLVAAVFIIREPDPVVATGSTTTIGATTSTRETTTTEDGTTTSRRRSTTTRANVIWTPWSPPDRSFTVDFTGQPEMRNFPGDGRVFSRASAAASETRTTLYLVGWYDLTSSRYASDSAFLLNTIVDAFAKEMSLTVTQRNVGHFAGNPSLDFQGTRRSEPSKVRGLEIVAGLRVFLFVVADTGSGEADFEHFRDSFHIN